MNHHRRSVQLWHVFSRDFTVLPAHQGLKWGRVTRVGDLAPFDLSGLQRVTGLLFTLIISCSSKSHKIPSIMHKNSPFSDQKINFKNFGRGHSTSDCGRDLLDSRVNLYLEKQQDNITRGHSLKLVNNRYHYDLRKFSFALSRSRR